MTKDYIRARQNPPKNYGEVPDDIILEDLEGNIVAHLMREWNNKGYYIIPKFELRKKIKTFVGTYYEAYVIVNEAYILSMGLEKESVVK